ncbi:induced stolen tip protein TUB8-like isoform X1 [Xiphophorus maculatus]|uniref:induced stolen tip protein TUB8-like isoform X1 n=1 Tax=Xiphophorus maculatus TaxID=8083 RepID=UPI000C6E2620|nr:induced stolen tip protein TUB8-like isoform X1 [Xiphophorus maculatus]
MKQVLILLCLLVSTFAAPAPGSESSEQAAAHANEALRLMEMYRLYQQQGLANPFLRAADTPANSAVAPAVVAFQAQLAPAPAEDVSDEETEDGNSAPRIAVPGAPGAPLNSDEEEEAEETEVAEVEPTVVDTAPADPTAAPAADPAAAAEPEVVDIPPDVAPVDGVVVAVPPVDIVPVDTAAEVPVDVAGPVATDVDVVDVPAATAAAEVLATL